MLANYRWRSISILGLALLGSLAFAQHNHVHDDYELHLKSNATSLERSLSQELFDRAIHMGCEPISPFQGRIEALTDTPRIGVPIPIRLSGYNNGSFTDAKITWKTTGGLKLRDDASPKSGTIQQGRAISVDSAIIVPGPGTYTVDGTILVYGGTKRTSYYGQTVTLYINATAEGVTISREKPAVRETQDTWTGAPVPTTSFDTFRLAPQVDTTNIHVPEPEEIELPDFGLVPTATTTVSGSLTALNPTGSLVGAYGAAVDIMNGGTQLATVAVDINGNFSVAVSHTGNINGAQLRVRTTNTRTRVTNDAQTIYQSSNFGSFNLTGSTANAGSWNYSTGGNIDRACYIIRELTRGWNSSVIDHGHDATFVSARFQNGTTGGAFYSATGDEQIQLREQHYFSPDVILHEYGHHHMDSMFGMTDYPPNSGGPHGFLDHVSNELAWSEGYASYFMIIIQNEKTYNNNSPGNTWSFDLEDNWDGDSNPNGNTSGNTNALGFDTESATCAFMVDVWDTADPTNDPFDYVQAGAGPLADIMLNYNPGGHNPYIMQEAIDGWWVRNQAKRPAVSGQAMTHGMKQAATRPTFGLSSGTSGWFGTWYWRGYGRGSFDMRNYGSQTQSINGTYAWLRAPGYNDHNTGSQIGGEPAQSVPAGGTVSTWATTEDVFKDEYVLGTYTITAGFWDAANTYRNLDVNESGTDTEITVNVVDDNVAPSSATVDDGVVTNSSTSCPIDVTAFDGESGIQGYWVQVGTSSGAGNVKAFYFNATEATSWSHTITGLSLTANVKYYVTVVARDQNGNDKWAYGDGFYSFDTSPPVMGTVTDDGATTTNATQLHWVANASDAQSGIVAWWYWIRDDSTGAAVRGWTRIPTGNVTSWDYTATGLSLVNGRQYTILVSAENASGYYGYAEANGIRVAINRVLSGRVVFQDRSLSAPSLNGRQIWVGVGSQSPSDRWFDVDRWVLTTINASGNFSIPDNTWFEAKRIVVVPALQTTWKTKSFNVNLNPNANTNLGNIVLQGGDANGDQAVDLLDYFALSDAYNTVPGDSAWDAFADFNEDGSVDLLDYFLLSDNYNTEGDW